MNLEVDSKYNLIGKLAEGGQGEVYLAEQINEKLNFRKKVAIKFISKSDKSKDAFNQEMSILMTLSHPNICQILDVGENDECNYIVLEYIDGVNLKSFISKCTQKGIILPHSALLEIISQVYAAIKYTHNEAKIFHGDISPHNILISKNSNIKLIDFGISKTEETKNTNEISGKPSYLPTDYLNGNTAYSAKTDIYSLGIIFYELITNARVAGQSDLDLSKINDLKLRDICRLLLNFEGDYSSLESRFKDYIKNSSDSFEQICKNIFDEKIISEHTLVENLDTNSSSKKSKRFIKKYLVPIFIAFGTIILLIGNNVEYYYKEKIQQKKFSFEIKNKKNKSQSVLPPIYPFTTKSIDPKWNISPNACEIACHYGAFDMVSGLPKNFSNVIRGYNGPHTMDSFYSIGFDVYKRTNDFVDNIYSYCNQVKMCQNLKDIKKLFDSKINQNQIQSQIKRDYVNFMSKKKFTQDELALLKIPEFYEQSSKSQIYWNFPWYSFNEEKRVGNYEFIPLSKPFTREDCLILGDLTFLLNILNFVGSDFNSEYAVTFTSAKFNEIDLDDKSLKLYVNNSTQKKITFCNYRRENSKLVYLNYWNYE